MYQPGEEMPMSPGYAGGYYPPANMYMPYGPAGMAYMGPPPHGIMLPPPPPGYEHPGQYQLQQQQQPPLQHGAGEDGQESPVAQGEGNGTIPPAEVSKSIPCKFFPNCRYGAQCAFQHPVQPPPPAFSPPPMAMYGYEQGPAYPPAFYPPFYSSPPPGAMGMAPPMHSVSPPPPPPPQQQQGAYPVPPPATTVDYSNDAAFIVNPQNQGMLPFMPSAMAPPFAPAFQPQAVAAAPTPAATAVESETTSDAAAPATQDEAASAAVEGSKTALQKAEETSAPSVAQAPAPVQQQQQIQQQQPQQHKGFPRKFGPFGAFPGKKFPKSGAKWVGGNAPPCSFFLNNACRNGDICRFPHLNAEGIDCRNPGVIDGSIAPAPISVLPGKPPRASYAANNFPMSSKAMAANKVASRAAAVATATTESTAASQTTPEAAEGVATTPAAATGEAAADAHVPSATTPAFVPGRHLGPAGVAANRQFAQARSQPASRPLSPNAGPHGGPAARGPRSLSAAPTGAPGAARRKDEKDAAALARQRVPSSDDFPALGGSVGSLKESTGSLAGSAVVVPAGAGKTAAQVLSAPAPAGANPSYAKPQLKKTAASAPVANKQADEDKERQASKSSDDGQSSTSGKTSDSDDVVVVDAAKSAPSAPNGAPSPMPPAVKKIPSFAAATMVGAIKA